MKSEHGRSCNDSSMGGGGGTQPRAPSATATVNEELGGSERDGDGGGRGGGLAGGHGGVGMRVVAHVSHQALVAITPHLDCCDGCCAKQLMAADLGPAFDLWQPTWAPPSAKNGFGVRKRFTSVLPVGVRDLTSESLLAALFLDGSSCGVG